MKKTVASIVTLVVVLAFAAAPAVNAHDFWHLWLTRPWERGDPGSTHQHWDFTISPGPAPTTVSNPYGNPFAGIDNGTYPDLVPGPDQTVIPTWHVGWLNTDADGTVQQMPGNLTLFVPNTPNPNYQKLIYVQITADKGVLNNQPPITWPPYSSVTSPGPVIQHPYHPWYTYNWLIEIKPNPEFERITFTFPYSTNISQVVVDTICVPEPSALASLGGASGMFLGLLALRRRKG